MNIFDNARNSMQKSVRDLMNWAYQIDGDVYEKEWIKRAPWQAYLVDYYAGVQKKALKPTKEGVDFNIVINLASLIVDRTVSMLFGGGVEFEYDSKENAEFLEGVWDANKKDILLHDLGQNGAIYGTGYVKILPGGVTTEDGELTYGLVALSPMNMIVGVNAHDVREVLYYVLRYTVNENGKTIAYREVTKKIKTGDDVHWEVFTQRQGRGMSNKWENVGPSVQWEYDFPPIHHAKNLPHAGSPYGRSDIEDVLGLQDDYNAAFSNVNKILWYHGHPHLWTNGKIGSLLDWSAEKILEIKGGGEVTNPSLQSLQLEGDLGASREFYNDIRRDLMDVSRTTDVETIKDKAGALTNFGLRVLFKDELAKTKTKQLLYGDFILEINRRLLILDNRDPEAGKLQWGEALPENENEETTALKSDLDMGIVSKKTVALRRGYDWDAEKKEISSERTQAGNVGGQIINEFMRGRGNTGQ